MAIVFDFQKMKNLQGRLNGENKIKIGILSDKTTRKPDPNGALYSYDNAGIGYKHEFGKFSPELGIRMPVRSFLRMPLKLKFESVLESKRFYKQEMSKILFTKSDDLTFFKKIGETARWCVMEAFKTGGFGQWKPSAMQFKKNHQTLVETNQLQRSVTYKVEMKK